MYSVGYCSIRLKLNFIGYDSLYIGLKKLIWAIFSSHFTVPSLGTLFKQSNLGSKGLRAVLYMHYFLVVEMMIILKLKLFVQFAELISHKG